MLEMGAGELEGGAVRGGGNHFIGIWALQGHYPALCIYAFFNSTLFIFIFLYDMM
jgi:hypothetical protein